VNSEAFFDHRNEVKVVAKEGQVQILLSAGAIAVQAVSEPEIYHGAGT
jgi:hypothetical protein